MKKLSILFCLIFTGCATSPKIARQALDKGMKANQEIDQAFFVKSWGLNRALITESREKWIARSQLEILKQSTNGALTYDQVSELIENLNKNLGEDEIVTSENFAYLSFLLSSSEIAQGYLDIVDYFVQSERPMIEHLLKSGKEDINDTIEEISSWESLIGNIKDKIPKFLKNVVE